MKKLVIILTVAFTACTSQVKTEEHGKESSKEQHNSATAIQLNNGSKWKADEATKRNVDAMMQVVSDSSYADAAKRKELSAQLQSNIDTLINQCRMKGPDHDALHVWLEKVLKDMKELKEGDDEYSEVYTALKKDIASFDMFFE